MPERDELLRTPAGSSAPDPSTRTVEQLYREIASLKELSFSRLDSIEKAQERFQDTITAVPTEVQKAVAGLRDVFNETIKILEEKFSSVQLQMRAAKEAVEQTSRDSKDAIAAALQAAKEAVGEQNKSAALAIAKSEASTNKQIDQQQALITSSTSQLNDKIDDLKQRLTGIENRTIGQIVERGSQRETRMDVQGDRGLWIAVASLGVTLVVVLVGVVLFVAREPAPPPVYMSPSTTPVPAR